jgi:hypothetical protein
MRGWGRPRRNGITHPQMGPKIEICTRTFVRNVRGGRSTLSALDCLPSQPGSVLAWNREAGEGVIDHRLRRAIRKRPILGGWLRLRSAPGFSNPAPSRGESGVNNPAIQSAPPLRQGAPGRRNQKSPAGLRRGRTRSRPWAPGRRARRRTGKRWPATPCSRRQSTNKGFATSCAELGSAIPGLTTTRPAFKFAPKPGIVAGRCRGVYADRIGGVLWRHS